MLWRHLPGVIRSGAGAAHGASRPGSGVRQPKEGVDLAVVPAQLTAGNRDCGPLSAQSTTRLGRSSSNCPVHVQAPALEALSSIASSGAAIHSGSASSDGMTNFAAVRLDLRSATA